MTVNPGSRKDRILRKISAVVVWATFRRVDVFRADDTTTQPGALMSTANHFGGFLDPLLAMYALPRRPRFIARDVIWKIPVARSIMRWIGAIPVHKAEDKGPGSNDQMFRSCYDALEEGGHLLIFPEGITRDEPSIGRVKTGTARIVLGARNAGARGISLVPVGIHYEDKAALRSRASILVGEGLNLDQSIDSFVDSGQDEGPDNRDAVRTLTAEIDASLRRTAPDFEDWQQATRLTRAAEVTQRAVGDPDRPLSLSQRDRLAGLLGSLDDDRRNEIIDSLAKYEAELEGAALTDHQVATRSPSHLWWDRIIKILLGLILLPYALVGFLLHLVPFLIVKGVGLIRLAPAAMASLKPIVAILVFGATWLWAAWTMLGEFGWLFAAATLLVVPLYGIAAVVLWERIVLGERAGRARSASAVEASAGSTILAARERLVRKVVEAL